MQIKKYVQNCHTGVLILATGVLLSAKAFSAEGRPASGGIHLDAPYSAQEMELQYSKGNTVTGCVEANVEANSIEGTCDMDAAKAKPQVYVKTLVNQLSANDAVSLGPDGSIYVSNFGAFGDSVGDGTQIIKVTPQGDTRVYTDGLDGPLGNFWGRDNTLYVIHRNTGAVGTLAQVDQYGQVIPLAEIPGFPTNITQDKRGNLYVTNFTHGNLTRISPDGTAMVFGDHPDLAGLVGVFYDAKQDVLIGGNYINGKILAIDMDGQVTQLAQVPSIVGYIAELKGNIYATGLDTHHVYQVSRQGDVKIVAGSGELGSEDGRGSRATFHFPNGIAADKKRGILYVSEFGGENNFRKIILRHR